MILMREMHDSIVEPLYQSLVEPCGLTMATIFNTVTVNFLFKRLPIIPLII